jgi:hypothetical protein
LRDRLFDGHGTYETDTFKYIGEWRDDLFDGHGRLELKDSGAVFEGEFAEGQRHGRGVIIYPDGSEYSGNWQNDKRHGKFVYTDGSGATWFNFWDNDKPAYADKKLR